MIAETAITDLAFKAFFRCRTRSSGIQTVIKDQREQNRFRILLFLIAVAKKLAITILKGLPRNSFCSSLSDYINLKSVNFHLNPYVQRPGCTRYGHRRQNPMIRRWTEQRYAAGILLHTVRCKDPQFPGNSSIPFTTNFSPQHHLHNSISASTTVDFAFFIIKRI